MTESVKSITQHHEPLRIFIAAESADETVKIEERKEENKMDGAVIVKVVIMALILVLVMPRTLW